LKFKKPLNDKSLGNFPDELSFETIKLQKSFHQNLYKVYDLIAKGYFKQAIAIISS